MVVDQGGDGAGEAGARLDDREVAGELDTEGSGGQVGENGMAFSGNDIAFSGNLGNTEGTEVAGERGLRGGDAFVLESQGKFFLAVLACCLCLVLFCIFSVYLSVRGTKICIFSEIFA